MLLYCTAQCSAVMNGSVRHVAELNAIVQVLRLGVR